ncbi:MAG TPA: radical SAM/SPASM domain-containing protein, partial [Pyrinomonadaceae bacterium]
YPVKAYIEPTLFCNLRCPACPTGLQLGLRPSTSIDVNVFKSAIDEIGDYLFELWMYNWGEPLLHKQTPEMIRYAKEKGIGNIRLSTNLSIPLTDDYIDRFVRSGLDELIVSLDGATQETYGKYRIRGEIDLVHRNMLRMQEAKTRHGLSTPNIIWQFLVFKHNEHQIKQAQANYRNWGADSIYFYGAEMPFEENAAGFEPSTIPEYNQYHPDHPQRHEMKRYKAGGKSCSWLYGVFLLNPGGKVSSCCSVVDEADDFGEYSPRDGFFQAWNSPRFRQARRLFTKQRGKTSKRNGAQNGSKPSNGGNALEKTLLRGKRSSLPIFNQRPSNATLSPDRIICHSCPIPYRMNEALVTIEDIAAHLLQSFHAASSIREKARLLTAYLLMGAPKVKTYARAFLAYRAPHFPMFTRALTRGMLNSISRAR